MDLWSIYRSYDGVLYKPALARRFGGAVAGLVLSQVLYWFMPDERGRPRARVVVDGSIWLAQTYLDWEAATALSEYQVRSVLQGLEARGILRLRKAMIPGRGWLLCVQPDQSRLTSILAGLETEAPHPSFSGVDPKKLAGGPKETSAPIRKDLLEICGETETVASAREVLKAYEAKQGQNPARLEHLWLKTLGQQTGQMQPPLTRKAQGMFKRVQDTLGDQASTQLQAILGDWQSFCLQVMSDKGLRQTPDKPSLPFLVSHLNIALAFGRQQVVNSSSVKPALAVEVVRVVEQPATREEIEEIMRESGMME